MRTSVARPFSVRMPKSALSEAFHTSSPTRASLISVRSWPVSGETLRRSRKALLSEV